MRNEQSPTPRGRNILGFRTGERRTAVADRVIAPERPAPPPTLPPPDRVQPPPEQAPQKPKKRHTVRNMALAGTALGVLGAGAYETYQNIPAVHRAVDSAFLDHLRGESLSSSNVRKFADPPPLRQPDIVSQHGSLEIPTITEYHAAHPEHFVPGIKFRFQEKPPIPNSTDINIRHPYVSMEGYVVKKEINLDGSVMLALEIPGKNGLFTPSDIDKSSTSLDGLEDNGNEGKLSGAIVWIKLIDWSNLPLPFASTVSWNNDFGSTQSGRFTWQPTEAYRYIRVGDPVHTSGATQVSSWAEAKLIENYQTKKNTLAYDEARKQYSYITEANALTLKRLIDDAKTGDVSLKEQLHGKRYVFEVSSLDFVPRQDSPAVAQK